MNKLYNEKYEDLKNYIKSLKKIAVAFSGGVDSTFLLKVCQDAIGKDVIAITVKAPYIPDREIKEVESIIKELKIEHYFLEFPMLEEIKYNPEDRCYICKTHVFSKIKEFSNRMGIDYVVDGSNLDDTKDYRPGMRALKELNIKSPLLECKLGKKDIREISKELGLITWDKPSYACLLSRIPYGEEIKLEELNKIEKGENYLAEAGFKGARIRSYGDLARIEVYNEQINNLLDKDVRKSIIEGLKNVGYKYVTLDLEGYRTGSMNVNIKGGMDNE